MKYTFTCRDEESGDRTTVQLQADGLKDMVEAFERFLRGVGFVFSGHLDITDGE